MQIVLPVNLQRKQLNPDRLITADLVAFRNDQKRSNTKLAPFFRVLYD